jgi:electron transfer flavoprotein beta subunit
VLAREYLGMGIDRLTLLKLPEGCDPLRPIAEHLARLNPAITLAGLHSEAGEGSGFLPYALAETLGLVMAPAIVELALEGSRVRLVQAISGGMRRLLSSPLPLMVTVDKAAPEPRQSAYSRARRGRLDTVSVESAEDITREVWRVSTARKRGRLTAASGANLTERLALITDARQGAGDRLVDPSGDKAARVIRDFLRSRGLLNQPVLADHNPRL